MTILIKTDGLMHYNRSAFDPSIILPINHPTISYQTAEGYVEHKLNFSNEFDSTPLQYPSFNYDVSESYHNANFDIVIIILLTMQLIFSIILLILHTFYQYSIRKQLKAMKYAFDILSDNFALLRVQSQVNS